MDGKYTTIEQDLHKQYGLEALNNSHHPQS